MRVPLGGCLWPKDIMSPEPATSFCSAPAVSGRSYCPEHLRLAYMTSAASRGVLAEAVRFEPEMSVIGVDRRVTIMGSYNFSAAAARDTEELNVVTSPEVAEAYAAHWQARQAISVRFADAAEWCQR